MKYISLPFAISINGVLVLVAKKWHSNAENFVGRFK